MAELRSSRQAKPSGQVSDANAIRPFGDDDLGMFTIAQIAMKGTDPVAPTHLVPGTPNVSYAGLWSRPTGAPLTRLARLSGWQSLPTGHQVPPWRVSV